MGFASENIGSPGFTGSGAMHSVPGLQPIDASAVAPGQPEVVRRLAAWLKPLQLNFRPFLQIPVLTRKWEKPHEAAPGIAASTPNSSHLSAQYLYNAPQHSRSLVQNTEEERNHFRDTDLVAGSVYQAKEDPEQRGVNIERVRQDGVGFHEPGIRDLYDADNIGNQPIGHNGGTRGDGLTDDVTEQVQQGGFAHDALKDLRSNYPYMPLMQLPARSRSVVLQQRGGAGSFFGELALPDGAVAARITWTSAATVDLFVGTDGGVIVPVAGNQPSNGSQTMADLTQDGIILNPDVTKYYFVKGKRALSFASLTATTVNVQVYMQA